MSETSAEVGFATQVEFVDSRLTLDAT